MRPHSINLSDVGKERDFDRDGLSTRKTQSRYRQVILTDARILG